MMTYDQHMIHMGKLELLTNMDQKMMMCGNYQMKQK